MLSSGSYFSHMNNFSLGNNNILNQGDSVPCLPP